MGSSHREFKIVIGSIFCGASSAETPAVWQKFEGDFEGDFEGNCIAAAIRQLSEVSRG